VQSPSASFSLPTNSVTRTLGFLAIVSIIGYFEKQTAMFVGYLYKSTVIHLVPQAFCLGIGQIESDETLKDTNTDFEVYSDATPKNPERRMIITDWLEEPE
jgi:hypothetical protein